MQPSLEAVQELKAEKAQVRQTLLTARDEMAPFDITSCSTLTQAVHRLAWIFRFTSNSRVGKTDRKTGPLTSDEKTKSLRFLIRDTRSCGSSQIL